jgi:hypothetical protein
MSTVRRSPGRPRHVHPSKVVALFAQFEAECAVACVRPTRRGFLENYPIASPRQLQRVLNDAGKSRNGTAAMVGSKVAIQPNAECAKSHGRELPELDDLRLKVHQALKDGGSYRDSFTSVHMLVADHFSRNKPSIEVSSLERWLRKVLKDFYGNSAEKPMVENLCCRIVTVATAKYRKLFNSMNTGNLQVSYPYRRPAKQPRDRKPYCE